MSAKYSAVAVLLVVAAGCSGSSDSPGVSAESVDVCKQACGCLYPGDDDCVDDCENFALIFERTDCDAAFSALLECEKSASCDDSGDRCSDDEAGDCFDNYCDSHASDALCDENYPFF